MNFHKLWLVLAIIFMGAYHTVNAEIVDASTAQKVATNFLKKQAYIQEKACSLESLKLLNYNRINETPAFYIFTLEQGFIIISAEYSTTPILAYSLENNLDMENQAPGVQLFLERYQEEINYIRENLNLSQHPLWNKYLYSNIIIAKTSENFVSPLLTSKWNQNKYYNAYCPFDRESGEGNDYRVPVGCVALTMASIMEYYRYPTTGEGSNSYLPSTNSEKYGRQTVKFYNQTYNYEAMKDAPNGYNSEMAKLIYHCGVSVKMNYTPDASGSNGVEAKDAFLDNWKFANDLSVKKRVDYANDSIWLYDIKEELNLRRPLYFSGTSASEGGHAFVCDGYDNNDKVHINWGWGGLYNGYFTVTNLAPGTMQAFNTDDQFFKNLYPKDSLSTEGHRRLTASSGSFAHGNFPHNYPAGKTYSWMLAVSEAYSYTLNFLRLNTDSADVITIYNGPNKSDGIKGCYFGHPDTLPSLYITKDSVLIEFKTVNTGEGFEIAYNTVRPIAYCKNRTSLKSLSGTINDNSGSKPYRYESTCSWIIETPDESKKALSIQIDTFALGSGDYIDIYNYTGDSMVHIYRYDTITPKNPFVLDGYQKIMLTFISDNYQNGDGFSLKYQWQIGSGVTEFENKETLQLLPNPATSEFTINYNLSKPSDIQIDIMDITGKILYSEQSYAQSNYTNTYNVEQLSKGLYFVKIKTDKGSQTQKLIIR